MATVPFNPPPCGWSTSDSVAIVIGSVACPARAQRTEHPTDKILRAIVGGDAWRVRGP
jgi:hypothetical protein